MTENLCRKPISYRERRDARGRSYDVVTFATDALKEGFRRGSYRLPRKVRRFLKRPLSAFAHRTKLTIAITTLAEIIGRFHTGSRNFIERGCGIGSEGAGFFLCRQGLARTFDGLTENLVRTATKFLLDIGFIERITPKGELTEVRQPKNATSAFGYFRTGQKAKKDALGRIRSPKVMFRLAPAIRRLFAERLSPNDQRALQSHGEPLWISSAKSSSDKPDGSVAGVHSGSAEFDRCSHGETDPRFQRYQPDPDIDPRDAARRARDRAEGQAGLAALERAPIKLAPPSAAAMAIFNRPPKRPW